MHDSGAVNISVASIACFAGIYQFDPLITPTEIVAMIMSANYSCEIKLLCKREKSGVYQRAAHLLSESVLKLATSTQKQKFLYWNMEKGYMHYIIVFLLLKLMFKPLNLIILHTPPTRKASRTEAISRIQHPNVYYHSLASIRIYIINWYHVICSPMHLLFWALRKTKIAHLIIFNYKFLIMIRFSIMVSQNYCVFLFVFVNRILKFAPPSFHKRIIILCMLIHVITNNIPNHY